MEQNSKVFVLCELVGYTCDRAEGSGPRLRGRVDSRQQDVCYFQRIFKKRMGITPLEYRLLH